MLDQTTKNHSLAMLTHKTNHQAGYKWWFCCFITGDPGQGIDVSMPQLHHQHKFRTVTASWGYPKYYNCLYKQGT